MAGEVPARSDQESTMGERGPIPKRSEERRRRNTRSTTMESLEAERVPVPADTPPVVAPDPNPDWHDVARRVYDAAVASVQSRFYEPSDWAVLYVTCESLSRDFDEQVVGTTESGEVLTATIPLKGASLTAYAKIWSSLLLTEGDRRRLRLEIERAAALDAVSADVAKARVVSDRESALRVIQGGKAAGA